MFKIFLDQKSKPVLDNFCLCYSGSHDSLSPLFHIEKKCEIIFGNIADLALSTKINYCLRGQKTR